MTKTLFNIRSPNSYPHNPLNPLTNPSRWIPSDHGPSGPPLHLAFTLLKTDQTKCHCDPACGGGSNLSDKEIAEAWTVLRQRQQGQSKNVQRV
jgi:hypothetical protein